MIIAEFIMRYILLPFDLIVLFFSGMATYGAVLFFMVMFAVIPTVSFK